MKKLIAFVCVLFTTSAFASDDYTAKLQDNGEYCARVKLQGPAGMPITKTKCLTVEEWEAAGYEVRTLEGKEVEV